MDVWVLLRVLVSIGVVFLAIWWLARRVNRGRGPRRANPVTVVGRQSIGAKSSIAVVDFDGRRLLLGVSEHQITVLSEAEAPEQPSFADELERANDNSAAPMTPAPHGALSGSILSAGTWKTSVAAVKRGLGLS